MEKIEDKLTTYLLGGLFLGLVLGGLIGFFYAKSTSFTTPIRADNELNGGIVPQPTPTLAPPETQPPQTPPPPPTKNVVRTEVLDDDPTIGNPDAKVVVAEFSDFQCPFCERAAATVKQITETYGDQILLVYRDYPLSSIHPEAQKAAEASECADDQGKFWEYHDTLFENRMSWTGIGVPKFKEYAADLSLDTAAFDECLDSDKYRDEVLSDLAYGQSLGVTGTPTFFVNDKMIVGAQPFENFKAIIDSELA